MRYFIFMIVFFTSSCFSQKSYQIEFTHDKGGHIIVPLFVNGVEIQGVFDTGAQGSVITNEDASRLGIIRSADSIALWAPFFHNSSSKVLKSVAETVVVGQIESRNKVSFNITSKLGNLAWWGYDIIDQYCWLFDFKTNRATISTESLAINTDGFVAIPYQKEDSTYITSIKIDSLIINRLMIDSGISWIKYQNEKYSIGLFLAKTQNNNNPITVAPRKKEDISKITDMHFPFSADTIGNSTIPLYRGIFALWDREKHHNVLSLNGHISLCYGIGYRYMYIDTKNQIIYLKK